MDKKTLLKISWSILLAAMFIFTVIFFFDIKFMVAGLNIIVWDILAAGSWIFVRLCRWAGRRNTGRRTLGAAAVTFLGMSALIIILFSLPSYIEETEPQTQRTFVAEYTSSLLNSGRVKLYERFGPLLFACGVEEYVGEFLPERPEDRQLYISDDGKSIVVAYFFLRPVFIVPLEQTE